MGLFGTLQKDESNDLDGFSQAHIIGKTAAKIEII
jgi:hypothetical protein